jgi:hypothetical protein
MNAIEKEKRGLRGLNVPKLRPISRVLRCYRADSNMRKFALLTLVGLLLAAVAVWWIRPNTNGGTAFVVVASILLVNVVGIAIRPRRKQGQAVQPTTPRAASHTARKKSVQK